MRFKTALLPLTMPMLLAACLGGGGGGGGGTSGGQSGPLTLDSTPTAALTSLQNLEANSLSASTAASSVNYSAAVAGGNVVRNGELSFEGAALRILTGDETQPEVEGDEPDFEVLGGRLTVNLPEDETLSVEPNAAPVEVGDYLRFDRVNEAEVATDRFYLYDGDDLEYMTFGIWELGLGGQSVHMGGAAWGALTPTVGDNSMPGGMATYEGSLIGHNVRETETRIYTATSIIEANFAANEVTFSSTGTTVLIGVDATPGLLDIQPTTGSITDNTFKSNENMTIAAGAGFTGQYGGAFYGPDAAEAGGWFELSNNGNNDRYFGSFGAAKQN